MTARELNIAFIQELIAIDPSFEYPNTPLSDQINYFLNLSQDIYLKSLLSEIETVRPNIKEFNKKLDAVKDLIIRNTLLVSDSVNPINTGNLPTGTSQNVDLSINFVLPNNYMFYIESMSKLSNLSNVFGGTPIVSTVDILQYVTNNLIHQTDITPNLLLNMFNVPMHRYPMVTLEDVDTDKGLSVYIGHYYGLHNIQLMYIKTPAIINIMTGITCELSAFTHQEIVTNAVKLFIEEFKLKLQTTK